jgi:hypothetical protein
MGKVAGYEACYIVSVIENDWSCTSASPVYHHVLHEGDLIFYLLLLFIVSIPCIELMFKI